MCKLISTAQKIIQWAEDKDKMSEWTEQDNKNWTFELEEKQTSNSQTFRLVSLGLWDIDNIDESLSFKKKNMDY